MKKAICVFVVVLLLAVLFPASALADFPDDVWVTFHNSDGTVINNGNPNPVQIFQSGGAYYNIEIYVTNRMGLPETDSGGQTFLGWAEIANATMPKYSDVTRTGQNSRIVLDSPTAAGVHLYAVYGTKPTFTTPPSVSGPLGGSATFSVTATRGTPELTYQWQIGRLVSWSQSQGDIISFQNIPGATGSSYTHALPSELNIVRWYVRCIVSNCIYTDPIVVLPYTATSENGSAAAQGAPLSVTFKTIVAKDDGVKSFAEGKYSDCFDGARLDGNNAALVAGTDFAGRDGSIIIDLKPALTATLAPGRHTLHVDILDAQGVPGTLDYSFVVGGESGVSDGTAGAASVPRTGDASPLWLLLAIPLFCGGAFCVRHIRRKKLAGEE